MHCRFCSRFGVYVFIIWYVWSVRKCRSYRKCIFNFWFIKCHRGTLTLPGIAGIVLTIGMAVDANVLIFERIRGNQIK